MCLIILLMFFVQYFMKELTDKMSKCGKIAQLGLFFIGYQGLEIKLNWLEQTGIQWNRLDQTGIVQNMPIQANFSKILHIPLQSCLFKSIPANNSLFQYIPSYSIQFNHFLPISKYFSIFWRIPAFFQPFYPMPAYFLIPNLQSPVPNLQFAVIKICVLDIFSMNGREQKKDSG